MRDSGTGEMRDSYRKIGDTGNCRGVEKVLFCRDLGHFHARRKVGKGLFQHPNCPAFYQRLPARIPRLSAPSRGRLRGPHGPLPRYPATMS